VPDYFVMQPQSAISRRHRWEKCFIALIYSLTKQKDLVDLGYDEIVVPDSHGLSGLHVAPLGMLAPIFQHDQITTQTKFDLRCQSPI
jgi:hypothetical protein